MVYPLVPWPKIPDPHSKKPAESAEPPRRCKGCGAPWEVVCSYCGRVNSGVGVRCVPYGAEEWARAEAEGRVVKARPLPPSMPPSSFGRPFRR